MNEISYVGEHLWVGRLGHLSILAAFVAALLSAAAYFMAFRQKENHTTNGWTLIGRYSFYLHSFTLLLLMVLVFYAMYNHMYEYSYVFDHVSADLPLKYILSAFWEGQEGSFMLWMFWHALLGIILIRTERRLEAPVLFVIAAAEGILMSMILGIYMPWGEHEKIGSNPLTLLREVNDAPIFSNADYLSLIKGRGLNPLLQNYWMTIHPPTLFLGFASTIVPFAYAFSGLFKNEHIEWMKKCLPWSLFSAAILGTGILMGSLWAYVALSFGGYWAWDPVENASLVPWITLIAGIHVHLVSKNTGHATRSVYFFYLVSFVLILYSTFLTRSGVLGDTSAHAFTEMGLEWQLIFTMLFFIVVGFGPWIWRFKETGNKGPEESLASREFWMFIGSMVLLFGSVLITISTSLPVINKIMTYFNPAYEGKVLQDPIAHYNKYQLWIAVFVAALSSVSMFLRYRATNWDVKKRAFIRNIALYAAVAGLMTFLTTFWIRLSEWQFVVLAFAGWFAVAAQLVYIFKVLKGNLRLGYSAIAHLGFGCMLIGILASGLNQKYISSNPFVFRGLFAEEDLKKYVQLIRGRPLWSQGYLITYHSDTLVGRERIYNISFRKTDDSLHVTDEIMLHPNAMYSNDFSKIAAFNPDTKHYIHKDIFTCIVGVPPSVQSAEEARKAEDSLKYTNHLLKTGDTLSVGKYLVTMGNVTNTPVNDEYVKHTHDAGAGVLFTVRDKQTDSIYTAEAALGLEGALLYQYPASFEEAGLRIRIDQQSSDQLFTTEDKIKFQEYTLKTGDSVTIGDTRIVLAGFDRNPKHPHYDSREKDIAVAALLDIKRDTISELAQPVYVIRDNIPMSIKSYSPRTGLHIRFTNIDPARETFSFRVGQEPKEIKTLMAGIANDVPRSDYIILEATIFPGINLFWAGSILMMVALGFASVDRFRHKLA